MRHQFVDFIPDQLDEGVLYITLSYDTAVHLCACGCGNEVVTPLSPAEWSFSYNGHSVSLSPSIGNWNYPCRSHYWIWKGQIEWARTWSAYEIAAVQEKDLRDRRDFYDHHRTPVEVKAERFEQPSQPKKVGIIGRLVRRLLG